MTSPLAPSTAGIAHFGTFDVQNFGDLLFPLIARQRLGGLSGGLTFVSPVGGAPVWPGACTSIPTRDAIAHDGFGGVLLGGGNIVHAREAGVDRYDDGSMLLRIASYPELWLGSALLAARCGIPLAWNAPGVPAPFRPQAAKLVRLAAAATDVLTVRDAASRRHLEAAGVDVAIGVVPDSAFDVVRLWSEDALAEARFAAFSSRRLEVPDRHAVFHVNARYSPEGPGPVAEHISRMAAALEAAPVLLALGPCHGDEELARDVARSIPEAVVVRPSSLVEVVALLRHAVLYAGSSMHGFVVSSAFGRPALLVADEQATGLQKFSGLLEQFHATHLLFSSWTGLANDFASVQQLPASTWRPFGAVARSRLDAHWARVRSALTTASGVDKSRLLAEPLGARSPLEASGLLGTLVSEMFGEERGRNAARAARLEQAAARSAREHAAADAEMKEAVAAAAKRETEAVDRVTASEQRARKLETHLAAARARGRDVAKVRGRIEALEAERTGLAASLATARARVQALEEIAVESRDLRSQVEVLRNQERQALAGYVSAVEQDTRTIRQLTERVRSAEDDSARLAVEARLAREEAEAMAAQTTRRTEELAAVQDELVTERSSTGILETQLAARQDELEGSREDALAVARELADLQDRFRVSKEELADAERVAVAIHEELAAASGEATAAAARAEIAEVATERGEEAIKRLRTERDRARQEREEVRGRLRDRERLVEQARRALADERQVVRELHEELAHSTADLERIAQSRAWRLGHGVMLAASRVLLRPPKKSSGAVEASVRRLQSLQERLERRKPLVIGSGTRPPGGGERRRRIAVVAWDMGHNPAGRAFLLADLLSRKHDVELVGAQFPRYGSDIWEPIRETSLKMRTFPGADFPEHLDTMQRFVSTLDVDVIYACKPRLPSLALAMLAREAHGTPVIIDVDDRELAFFGGVGAADLGEVRGASGPELAQPFGEMWTRYGDGLVSGADAVTTSNHTLQSLYGGDIVAHARDELRFDPSLYDREAIRAQLGFQPDDRVVLFSGTPRLHKGIGQIADALEAIGNPRYKLCVIGTVQDTAVRDRLARMDPETVRLLPNQPFEALPSNMMAGDLVCLLQDPASEIARYQMPAKLTDALAMEVPVIATAVAPLEPLGRRGLITFIEGDGGLALQIDAAFENFDEFREQARRARSFFLKELSYEAVGQQLERTLEGLTGRSHALPSPWRCTLEFLRERYGPASIGAPRQRQGPRRARPAMADDDWDIVFCWKQNDSGLYGRRSDMLAQYLARSERVGKVVHFDAPIDFATYRKHLLNGRSQSSHQSAQIYEVTRRRTKGRAHAGDLRNYTFLHQSEEPGSIAERRLPKASEHLDWMERVLRKEGVGSRRTILWTCPVHFAFNDIVERIDHDLVVADVIDDHRAWLTAGTNYYLRVQENYRNILSAADVVLANCEPVGQRMLAFGVAAYVLPNAMEIWDGPQYSRAPAELRKLKGPIVGYVGNLSSRIDMDLLEHVVPARPDWNFVFIGSAHLSRDILRLDRHSNVHFLGVKRYPEVVAYIRAFDAGMIPHQDNEMTQAMSPLKAFVYAGCGVATVTTEIGNLTNLRSYVRTARTHEGFLAELDDVVAASVGGKDIRPPRSFLEQHTWSARVRVVEQVIDSALGDDDDGVSVPGAAAPGRASPSGQAPG